jgi:predicted amidohydrolase
MKVAGVQIDVQLGLVEKNIARISRGIGEASAQDARLIVFPECAVTGYCFDSYRDALEASQTIPGPTTESITSCCRSYDVQVLVGLLEQEAGRLFNSAVLIGPGGVAGVYRKVHLPLLGVDRYTCYGDRPFAVHDVYGTKIGINICYDANFPEAARCLSLLGADLIALPTNWVLGPGSLCTLEHVIHARALDNGVYFLAVNRVGVEGGFRFMGRSKLVGPDGQAIAECPPDAEAMIFADIDTSRSRAKHVVRIPGKHESHRLADRRPHMYSLLTEPHNLTSPWRH